MGVPARRLHLALRQTGQFNGRASGTEEGNVFAPYWRVDHVVGIFVLNAGDQQDIVGAGSPE